MSGNCRPVKRVRFDLSPASHQPSNFSLSRRAVTVAREVLVLPPRAPLRKHQCPNIKKLFHFSTLPTCKCCLKVISLLFFGIFLIPYAVYKDLNLPGVTH